jgi:hypothetical protein
MSEQTMVDTLVAQVRAMREENDKLLEIIGCAYQVAGAHGAPVRILDVLADPQAATAEQIDAMLPYTFDDMGGEPLTVDDAYEALFKAGRPLANWWRLVDQPSTANESLVPDPTPILAMGDAVVTAGQLRALIRALEDARGRLYENRFVTGLVRVLERQRNQDEPGHG